VQIAARKRNSLAMMSFTLAFQSEGLFGMIYDSYTDEYPSGLAHKVVKALLARYKPSDTISRVELRMKLNQVRMSSKEDPAKLFERISELKNRFKSNNFQIDKDDLIAVVITAAPDMYKAVVTSEQRARGDLVTLNDLEEAMRQHYRTLVGAGLIKVEKPEIEVSFGSIVCYNCHKEGHIARNCPEKGNGNGEKSSPKTCEHCGKQGHVEASCWELHLERAPLWFQEKKKWYEKQSEEEESGEKVLEQEVATLII